MLLNINIVNRCNLQCPSCPRGRGDMNSDKEEMSLELFTAICEKAVSLGLKLTEIQPYDNTEPTLHSDLPGIIAIGKRYAPIVTISTNAHVHGVDWDSIFGSGLTRLTVTVSGLSQETYGVTHYPAKIDRVLRDMESIHRAWVNSGKRARIELFFLRYLNNLHEEAAVRDIGERFGFLNIGVWASTLTPFSQADKAGCVLTPQQAMAIGKRHKLKECYILTRNINIDHRGYATQCAGFTEGRWNFLELNSVEELQTNRRTNPKCVECFESGLVHYVCRNPHLDKACAAIVGDNWLRRWQRWRHWAFWIRETHLR